MGVILLVTRAGLARSHQKLHLAMRGSAAVDFTARNLVTCFRAEEFVLHRLSHAQRLSEKHATSAPCSCLEMLLGDGQVRTQFPHFFFPGRGETNVLANW